MSFEWMNFRILCRESTQNCQITFYGKGRRRGDCEIINYTFRIVNRKYWMIFLKLFLNSKTNCISTSFKKKLTFKVIWKKIAGLSKFV
jgi:hypothetical protein